MYLVPALEYTCWLFLRIESIFCSSKITLGRTTLPHPPPIMPYLPITYFFSYFYFFTSPPHHPITQSFEILKCPSLHPFVTEEKIKRGGGGGGWLIQKSLPRTLNLRKKRTRSHIFVVTSCLSDSIRLTKTSKLVAAALMWKGLKRAQISSLLWKSTSHLELLVNQCNNETLETNDPKNIFFKYFNIYKMHHIEICNKNKCPSSIWIHVLLINDLQYLTSFTKVNFDLKRVTETRILNRYLY